MLFYFVFCWLNMGPICSTKKNLCFDRREQSDYSCLNLSYSSNLRNLVGQLFPIVSSHWLILKTRYFSDMPRYESARNECERKNEQQTMMEHIRFILLFIWILLFANQNLKLIWHLKCVWLILKIFIMGPLRLLLVFCLSLRAKVF